MIMLNSQEYSSAEQRCSVVLQDVELSLHRWSSGQPEGDPQEACSCWTSIWLLWSPTTNVGTSQGWTSLSLMVWMQSQLISSSRTWPLLVHLHSGQSKCAFQEGMSS